MVFRQNFAICHLASYLTWTKRMELTHNWWRRSTCWHYWNNMNCDNYPLRNSGRNFVSLYTFSIFLGKIPRSESAETIATLLYIWVNTVRFLYRSSVTDNTLISVGVFLWCHNSDVYFIFSVNNVSFLVWCVWLPYRNVTDLYICLPNH